MMFNLILKGKEMDSSFYAHLNPIDQFEVLKRAYLAQESETVRKYCLQHNVLSTEAIKLINENIFYDIPFHYGFRITTTARVANLYEYFEVEHTLNETGYPAVTVIRDNTERSITAHIHRLLALTFLTPSDRRSINELQVNHINGIKTDYSLTNLEWVTKQRNCEHAYQTGLRSDNTPIRITCSVTSNSFVVYSMGEAGRFFGVTAAAIHWQLNNKKSNTPYKGYYLKYERDNLVQSEVISN